MNESVRQTRARVKALAREEGFACAGVAAPSVDPLADRFESFLQSGFDASMSYLRRNVSKRRDPKLLVPTARSVLCLAVGYAPHEPSQGRESVARYARGRDYHKMLKRRCISLMDRVREEVFPELEARAFVDSAPVAERSLAVRAGLGWIGRNGCLICSELGSYVVLCEIVWNLPLEPDLPASGGCGDCTACREACPTGAIGKDGLVDSRRCLSYLTIEYQGHIDQQLWPEVVGVFGCDVCQAVCPANRNAPPGDSALTAPLSVATAGLAEILGWSCEQWSAVTAGSAVRRAGHEGLLRNAILAAGNSGDRSLTAPLEKLRRAGSQWQGEIDWALARLGGGR